MSRSVPVDGRSVPVNNRAVTYGSDIPDSDIYLHDDWNDGKLTNRDDSGTATTNGQEGIYRPEWNEFQTSVNVVDKYGDADDLQMELTQSSGIDIDYSLPDDSIRWEFEFRKDGDDGDNGLMFILSADASQNYIPWRHIGNNNITRVQTPNKTIDASGDLTDGNVHNIVITRDTSTSPATWEYILDGTSVGTIQDDGWYSGYIGFENNNKSNGKYVDFGNNAPDSNSWWDDMKISPL